MKYIFKLYLSLLPFMALCSEPLPPEIRQRLDYAAEHKNKSYNLGNAYVSKKEAVHALLVAASKGSQEKVLELLLPREKFIDIYWVNEEEWRIKDPGMTFDNAWLVRSTFNGYGALELTRKLTGKTIEDIEVVIKKSKKLNTIVKHDVAYIKASINGKPVRIEEIQSILEHDGQFRVLSLNID